MVESRPSPSPMAEIIYNPGAGRNRKKLRVLQQATHRLLEHGYAVRIRRTEHPGHATELAQDAAFQGAEVVFAMGGDGTINEVAKGLIGSETVLGVLPQGHINVFKREAKIPRDTRKAIDAQLGGYVHTMDAGRIRIDGKEPHEFFFMAGIGYDGLVFNAVQEPGKKRKKGGTSVYLGEAVKQRKNADTPGATLTIGEGDEKKSHEITNLSQVWINNTRNVAWVQLREDSRCDDGTFEVTVFDGKHDNPKTNIHALGRDMVRKLAGRRRPVGQETRLQGSRLTLSLTRPLSIEIDGEPIGSGKEIDIIVLPGALRVLSPEQNVIFSKEGQPASGVLRNNLRLAE